MGRGTVKWRTASRRGRAPTPTAVLAVVTVAAALCTAGAASTAAAAPGSEQGSRTGAVPRGTTLGQRSWASSTPDPYAFAKDAKTVEGADGTTDAVRLEPGGTYRSSIKKDGKLYYRLELDATSSAYVSATAVPRLGTTVSSADGVKVTVQDADGSTCSAESAHLGPTQSPHPVTAWAAREIGSRSKYACQEAGTYYAVVERSGPPGSAPDDWDLELDYASEPRLREAGSTAAPDTWNSAPPDTLLGDAGRRTGGMGFSTAVALRQGVWQTGIRAGQTLFYRVPVDWGQQLYATAELGSSPGGDGYVGTALSVSLYNPAHGHVDDVGCGYDGSQRSAVLRPLPPVQYDNRYAITDRVSAMRFAGSYYLVVHLGAQVAEKFGDGPLGLTLRVRVNGTAEAGPAYAGQSQPRGAFDVSAQDRAEADAGTAGSGRAGGGDGGGGGGDSRADGSGGGDRMMKLVAAAGIGSGCVLVLTLALWRVVARRRADGGWGERTRA
ncbi:hypothetical protein ACFVYF_05760 [Streptomyces sp. NPDC058274]|uniref:hypothetical protein n=1 Tax=Streptomyces sp. NPDC058274 TaxID=3346416 RepID=UPI0036E75805